MKRKRQKGYWSKRIERFAIGSEAKERAQELRQHQHVSHVVVDKAQDSYTVAYSVAQFYLEELAKAGIKL